jgi:pyridoxamine 5'-phosphate oxidase
MAQDPIEKFSQWLEEAKNTGMKEPTAMTVATATPAGKPSARILLLKGVDKRGFVFYSNRESRKGGELAANQQVALCFYWMPLGKQVRVEGSVAPVSAEEADAYFASRHRDSRIGAWASKQSRPLASREELVHRIEEYTKKFEGKDVPRPEYWIGWRLVPERIEFWAERPYRLHDREVYARKGNNWQVSKLYP